MKDEQLEKIAEILGETGEDKSKVGEAILELIESTEDESEAFEVLKVAIIKRNSFPSAKKPLNNAGIDDKKWNELNQFHYPIIVSHLKLAFVNSKSEDEFVTSCQKVVNLFSEKSEKIFALSSIIFSPFVPYRQIVGTLKSVSDEEYNDLLKMNEDLADDLNYVTGLPFEDLPSECLNVIHVLNKTDDEKLKVALLALYVSHKIRFTMKKMANN